MDIDTETRRIAPIAYFTGDTVDIINGVQDSDKEKNPFLEFSRIFLFLFFSFFLMSYRL